MAERPLNDRRSIVGRLYDQHGASLYRYALMLLADPAGAADAVQQVFTALLRPAATIAFDNEGYYLRRAVRNEGFSSSDRSRLDSSSSAASDASAGGNSFMPRRWGCRQGQHLTGLQPAGPVDQAVLNTAEYFVTVRLSALDPSLVMERPTPRAAMMAEVDDEVSPLLQRLDADARTLLFRTREPRIRRPIFAAAESRRASLSGGGRQPT